MTEQLGHDAVINNTHIHRDELFPKPRSWDAMSMELARSHASMSKDPSTQVGCVVVSPDRRRITGGFNGFPSKIPDLKLWWHNRGTPDNAKMEEESLKNKWLPVLTKYDIVVHAEMNAILQAKTDLTDWTLYCTHRPCIDCARLIIVSGITRVVFAQDQAAVKMDLKAEKVDALFKIAGVDVLQYKP